MSIPAFAVRRPVTVLMVFIAAVLFGMLSLSRLPIDLYPEIELPTITVITTYPGASALEVEEKVTRVLEGQVAVVTGIKGVRSLSKENLSAITCEFHFGTGLDEAASEIRSNLEFARMELPEACDDPMVLKINTSMFPVVIMAVYRETGDVFADYDLIEDVVIDPLKSVDGVGNVNVFNATPRRLEIRVDRDRLEGVGLALADVISALSYGNVSAPAGTLDVGISDYSLQLKGEFKSLEEVRQLAIGLGPGGGIITLGDIADVVVDYPRLKEVATYNGRPCLMMMVNKRSGANTVAVARDVKQELARMAPNLPPGIKAEAVYDLSTFIVNMIDNLTNTVYMGGIFVIAVVMMFLRRIRSSFIIAATIPASLLVGFGGLALFGFTINMFSLMSMAIAIGMVVDNAIVVLENISRHRERGLDRQAAAAIGGTEVSSAVVASTLTSVAIFGPLILISGFVGVLFKQLAFVVTIVLAASLIASLLLTPALASWFLPVGGRRFFGKKRGKQDEEGRMMQWLESVYGRLLAGALRHRLLVTGGSVLMFVGTMFLTGTLGSGFMPKQDVGDISATIELPVGTTTAETSRIVQRVLDIMRDECQGWEQLYFFRAGASEMGIGAAMGQREGANIGEAMIHLVPINERPETTHEIAARIRPRIAAIPEIKAFSLMTDSQLTSIFAGGEKPLTIRIKGPDLESLNRATLNLTDALRTIPGAIEVAAILPEERPEIKVEVDRLRASRMGVPMAMAANALRAAFYGIQAGTFRSNGAEMDLFLRLEEDNRSRLDDLLNIPLKTPTGAMIRLRNIASLNSGFTPVEIQRVDQQRSALVQGDVSGRPMGDVIRDIEARMRTMDFGPGITAEFGGDIEEQQTTMNEFLVVLILGITLVYMVMAAQFESFLDPFVIMMSVPFAFTGVFGLLVLTRTDLTVPAYMGLIMLMGTVVNNAIVLISYIKQLRADGLEISEAIAVGGKRRLRPVLMTTMTTIFGMLPMVVAGGEGHEMWRPMGIAVIGGLSVSTLVTLIFVPIVYSLLDRLRIAPRREPHSRDRLPTVESVDQGGVQ